jgi:hypothetical protein
MQAVTGVKERGCIWIAAPGVEYRTRHQVQYDKVLFNGPTVVQLTGPERRIPGAIKIEVAAMTVFDRRNDRMSSFARAEHVQRTVGRHSFQFVNLRDITVAELRDDPPERILTNDGLVSVED